LSNGDVETKLTEFSKVYAIILALWSKIELEEMKKHQKKEHNPNHRKRATGGNP
jgi:hypothetical protein